MRDNQPSRRSILKSTGAVITGSAVSAQVVGAATQQMKTIPAATSGGEIIDTKEVPMSWYNRYKQTKRAVGMLNRSLRANTESNQNNGLPQGVSGIAMSSGDEYVGNVPALIPEIMVNPSAERNISLPSEAGGLRVKTTEEAEQQPSDCLTRCGEAKEAYNDVPGGVKLACVNDGNWVGTVTSSCKVTYNGEPHLLTCAHAFNNDGYNPCETDGIDDDSVIYQPIDDPGYKAGTHTASHDLDDWALFKRTGSSDIDSYSSWISGNNYKITGVVSQENAAYLASWGSTVKQKGQNTCLNEGPVTRIYQERDRGEGSCTTTDWINSDIPSKGGDSGSPIFYPQTEGEPESYLLHIHWGSARCAGSVSGVSGYKLENEYGIEF